jgi:hypothetical protein
MSLMHSMEESRRARQQLLNQCLLALADRGPERDAYLDAQAQELQSQQTRAEAARRMTADLLALRE